MSSAEPRPSVFLRHPALTLGSIVAVLFTLLDLGFTRAYVWLRAPGPSHLRVRDPLLHHALKPLSSADERWGPWHAQYQTNSLGLRDRSTRTVPLKSEKPRLLFIGDSFTEGIGVPYEQTFVGRVEAALAADTEVLGAGTASYCPIIYRRRLQQLLDEVGLELQHVAVFIDMGDIQDEVAYRLNPEGRVVSREARRIEEEKANRRWDGSIEGLWPLQRWLSKHMLLSAQAYGLLLRLRAHGTQRAGAWVTDEEPWREFGREGLELASTNLDALKATLDRHGVGLTVAVYPWPDHVRASLRETRQSQFWRDWCAARGVDFLDYHPHFTGGDGRETVRRLFIPGDIHWNEAGHAVIAEGFLGHWRKRP